MGTDSAVMVIAHRPHELIVLGQMMKYQPDLFVISNTPGIAPEEEAAAIQETLSKAGVQGDVTVFESLESDLYRALLKGDRQPFEMLLKELTHWLGHRRPNVVLTDGFEYYNPIHDLSPMLTSAAIQRLPEVRAGVSRALEIPLAHVGLAPDALDESNWQGRRSHRIVLDEHSGRIKDDVMRNAFSPAMQANGTLAADDPVLLAQQWTPQQLRTEFVCDFDLDRDYTAAPQVFGWDSYDVHGQRRVDEGKYAEALTFEKHFAPLVRSMCNPNRESQHSVASQLH